MTTEEFWNRYINNHPVDIYDEACEFFSAELPQEFLDHYDVRESVLEIKDKLASAKEFDKAVHFLEIIREMQPGIYAGLFQYIDRFLVDYHCFLGEEEKVKQDFSNFLNNALHDYDLFFLTFKALLFYEYTALLDQAVEKNYEAVCNSDQLWGAPEEQLAICKLCFTLEDLYKEDKEYFNRDQFINTLSKYDFEYDPDWFARFDQGVFSPQLDMEELKATFLQDRDTALMTLNGHFFRHMYEKYGFTFALSNWIWLNMLRFLDPYNEREQQSPDSFFSVEPDEFDKYIGRLSGDFLTDNQQEMIATLWGSVYMYEFLQELDVISSSVFDSFIETSKYMKGLVIAQLTPDLWKDNFVHHWKKPDCIDEQEFHEEEKIFRKSATLKHQRFSRLRSEISEELSRIGELSEYIVEGGKTQNQQAPPTLDDLLNTGADSDSHQGRTPVKAEKKPGRNEPCPCGSGKKYKKCCGKNN